MGKTFLGIMLKPLWVWVFGLMLQIIGGIIFIFPDWQPILTWPAISKWMDYRWWIIIGLVIWGLAIAWEATKKIHKERNDKKLTQQSRSNIETKNQTDGIDVGNITDSIVNFPQPVEQQTKTDKSQEIELEGEGNIAYQAGRDLTIKLSNEKENKDAIVEAPKIELEAFPRTPESYISLKVSNVGSVTAQCRLEVVDLFSVWEYEDVPIIRNFDEESIYLSWHRGRGDGEWRKLHPRQSPKISNIAKIYNGMFVFVFYDVPENKRKHPAQSKFRIVIEPQWKINEEIFTGERKTFFIESRWLVGSTTVDRNNKLFRKVAVPFIHIKECLLMNDLKDKRGKETKLIVKEIFYPDFYRLEIKILKNFDEKTRTPDQINSIKFWDELIKINPDEIQMLDKLYKTEPIPKDELEVNRIDLVVRDKADPVFNRLELRFSKNPAIKKEGNAVLLNQVIFGMS